MGFQKTVHNAQMLTSFQLTDKIMEVTYDRHTQYLYCTKIYRGQIIRVYTGLGPLTSEVVATTSRPVDVALDAGTRYCAMKNACQNVFHICVATIHHLIHFLYKAIY